MTRCYTQPSLPPPPRPHPPLLPTPTPTSTQQQHNTCVRLGETTLHKAGEEADSIRRRNLKSWCLDTLSAMDTVHVRTDTPASRLQGGQGFGETPSTGLRHPSSWRKVPESDARSVGFGFTKDRIKSTHLVTVGRVHTTLFSALELPSSSTMVKVVCVQEHNTSLQGTGRKTLSSLTRLIARIVKQ